jgi:hypothetical protein
MFVRDAEGRRETERKNVGDKNKKKTTMKKRKKREIHECN